MQRALQTDTHPSPSLRGPGSRGLRTTLPLGPAWVLSNCGARGLRPDCVASRGRRAADVPLLLCQCHRSARQLWGLAPQKKGRGEPLTQHSGRSPRQRRGPSLHCVPCAPKKDPSLARVLSRVRKTLHHRLGTVVIGTPQWSGRPTGALGGPLAALLCPLPIHLSWVFLYSLFSFFDVLESLFLPSPASPFLSSCPCPALSNPGPRYLVLPFPFPKPP